MVQGSVSAASANASDAASKRKWAEVDWEVVMEAQSFVAVYADLDASEASADVPPVKAAAAKRKAPAKKRGRKSKKSKAEVAAPAPVKRGHKGAKVADEPTRASPRTRGRVGSVSTKTNEEEEEEKPKTPAAADEPDAFWLAQLLDDVTEAMLEDDDASVRVTWLNRVSKQRATGKTDQGYAYEYAFDDTVTVQSILCHVYVVEGTDERLELTPKSLTRVRSTVVKRLEESSQYTHSHASPT